MNKLGYIISDRKISDLRDFVGNVKDISQADSTKPLLYIGYKNAKKVKGYKNILEKKIDDNTKLIDQAEKYLKHKNTYKAYTKTKKNKREDFYNEHTAEIIIFESSKKYLKGYLGESKTLNISKWKSEVTALKTEKDSLYSQIIDLRKEVEQVESVRSCIEKLQQENRGLTQVKKQELNL